MTESELTRKLCAGLTKAGVLCEAIVGGATTIGGRVANLNRPGRPDRWFATVWWHGWMEFKKDTGKLRDDQRIWIWQALCRRRDSVLLGRFVTGHSSGDKLVLYSGSAEANYQVKWVEEGGLLLKGILDDRYWEHEKAMEFANLIGETVKKMGY